MSKGNDQGVAGRMGQALTPVEAIRGRLEALRRWRDHEAKEASMATAFEIDGKPW